ncbi:MAG: hypothetical protein AAFZ63_28160 [Bacteroidota bacterium]
MEILNKVNGFEIVDYIHGNGKPAIRFQFRINENETNVIGWYCYGPTTRMSRQEAIELIEEDAIAEDYQYQVDIHQ